MSIRTLVVVSDIHCGSQLGLLPPDFRLLERDQPCPQNALQEFLWSCWVDAWNVWLPSIVPDGEWALVVNGDVREGVHHGGKQIISTDSGDHDRAAEEVLAPLAKRAAKTFIIEGTDVHSGTGEHKLAKALKAEPDPNTGKPAWERLDLTVAGVRAIFFHHISTTSREYLRGTALSIFLGNEQLSAAKNNEPIPMVLGMAHRHGDDEYRHSGGCAFVSPAWQALTRHGMKVVPMARCKPGIVVVDWRGKRDGELPELHWRVYQPPEPKGIIL